MRMDWNTDQFLRQVRHQLASRLYIAATTLQTALKGELSTAYPPASSRGEYPHARTFEGRNSLVVSPPTIPEIEHSLVVRIGFRENAWYMGYLEAERGRLGLLYKYREMQGELGRILQGGP